MTMRGLWCGVATGALVALLLAYLLRMPGPGVEIRSGRDGVIPESGYADAVQIAERLAAASPERFRLPSRDDGRVVAPGTDTFERDVAASDAEWVAMRRSSFAFAQHVATTGHALRLHKIFRHKALNPRDVYLAPCKRQELADILRPLQVAMGETLDARHSITAKEMAELVAKGGAALVASSNLSEVMAAPELGRQFNVVHKDGGRIYFANSQDLPGSSLAESVMHAQGVEIGCAVVSWFYRQGCLDHAEGVALLEGLSGSFSWNGK